MMREFGVLVLLTSASGLINNDWATLSAETTIRLVTPDTYHPSDVPDEIWQDMGRNITCWADQDGAINASPPPGFDPSLPLKILTHGFSSRVYTDKTLFVPAWMEATGRNANVVLLDWSGLAWFIQADDWDNAFYDEAARNAIDVGEFLGRCLAALVGDTGLAAGGVHLAGHSLGAHLMGKAARVLHEVTGQRVARISALDPAGPRFVDGPILGALPELAENILTRESASFVDVIHTNGAFKPAVVWVEPRSGLLQPLGHLDFYPSGGSVQPGCEFLGPDALPGGLCSHRRATHYFIHSIKEPHLFPALACATPELCNEEVVSGPEVVGYMGEAALQGYTGEAGLRYLQIQDHHWDYTDHY